MPILYIMCGVAFSGKSTLAKKIAEYKKAVLVSQDKIWFIKEAELHLDWDSDEDWEKVQQISRVEVKETLMKGNSVVYDDISLKYTDRELLRNLAKECGAEAVLVYLDTPRSVQQERQSKNLETKERHDVPDHIIDWGLKELEVPTEDEHTLVFKPDSDLELFLSNLK